MSQYSKEDFASLIDHTNLYSTATEHDIETLCEEATEYGFGSVCIYPADVPTALENISSDTNICAVIGFPSGRHPKHLKAAEAHYAVEEGANEIDVVLHQGYIQDEELDKVVEELEHVRATVGKDTTMKVITENCNLTEEQKIEAYKAADEAGADFIKTSTGFGDHGAKYEDIELMADTIEELDSDMGIKASGGIGNFEDAERMLEASRMPLDPKYFRIGASGSIDIIEGFQQNNEH